MKPEVSEHAFCREILNSLQPYLSRSGDGVRDWFASDRQKHPVTPTPSALESYDLEIFQAFCGVTNTTERLERSIALLSVFPAPATLERLGVTQDLWIEYHYGYFLASMAAIVDVSLLLVNAVLRLGYPERYCKLDQIKKNRWVKEAGLDKHLRELETLLQTVKTERNLHLHRGKQASVQEGAGASSDYGLLTFVVTAQRLSGEELAAQEDTEVLFGFEVRAIVDTLEEQLKEAVICLHAFFDSLCPLYRQSRSIVESDTA